MSLLLCTKLGARARGVLLRVPSRNGYIVLVPEIGEDQSEQQNPLRHSNGLPEFSQVTIENCMAAVAKQTLDFENSVRALEARLRETPTTNVRADVLEPLERAGAPLDMTWGLAKTMYLGNSTLMPTKSYLAIHERAKRARAFKFNSSEIYQAVVQALDEEGESKLSAQDRRVLQKFELEGRLNGLLLDDKGRAALNECMNRMLKERQSFRVKNETSTKRFTHMIEDRHVMQSFPDEVANAMAIDASVPSQGPWQITLQPHLYVPFMEHCPDRTLRWNVWQAMVSRGSGYGDKELETSTHIEHIRFLRLEQAKFLGYKSFADMSMETKMAGSVENVRDTLDVLNAQAQVAQKQELASLNQFAQESGCMVKNLELWDVPYWRRKQRRAVYGFEDTDYSAYFPLDRVLSGLFALCERLFGLRIVQRTDVVTWHKDVRFYDVHVVGRGNGNGPAGSFYIDPYARPDAEHASKPRVFSGMNPGGNSWMVGVQSRSQVTSTSPIAALVFNFNPIMSNDGRPVALLSLRDLSNLFHRFGQTLQHVLTDVRYSEVAGLSNVEWDAVSVAGHVLTHWLLDRETVIKYLSCHWQTGEPLPDDMFDAMVAVHKHGAGLDMARELYLSTLDLDLHMAKREYWLDIVKRLWSAYRPFPLLKEDSHLCSFTAIFTEEWAAAYYSHIWSRMIAADIYGAFHENRNSDAKLVEVGHRYRDIFLTLGGSCHPSQMFRKFRGRDPTPKALLASLGMNKLQHSPIDNTSCPDLELNR